MNPPQDCYCRKVWPGGILCVPKGATPPGGKELGRISGSASGGGKDTGGVDLSDCYPFNIKKGQDLGGTGSFFGDVGAREAGAGVTEKALQDIAAAERAADAGKIDDVAAAIRIAAAIKRAETSNQVAATSYSGGPSTRPTRGNDGRVIKRDEIDGVCNQPPPGPVFCRVAWPGGFRGADQFGNPPGAGWLPATEEKATVNLVDARTGKTTTATVTRLVKNPGCYPQAGTGLLNQGGAFVVRAAIRVAEETPGAVADTVRNIARHIRRLPATIAQAVEPAAIVGAIQTAAGGPVDRYCKTVWPGGIIGVPRGSPAPPGPWAAISDTWNGGPPCYQV